MGDNIYPQNVTEEGRKEVRYYIVKVISCTASPRNARGIVLATKSHDEHSLEALLKKRLYGVRV